MATKTYKIQYNVFPKSLVKKWSIIDGDDVITISDIKLHTDAEFNDNNITVKGNLVIKDDVAFFTKSHRDNATLRHIIKTLTWRIIGTLDTMFLGWFVTGNLKIGLTIGGIEVISKMILYFIHERIWYKFGKIGRKK